ncbi:hypothetical protein U9M48_037844 [Paspalum notatum var. saurae]|uniref:Histidine-containing phosphotransfer protein n=1 Tax=Paspalum notatum var. saurae TaxID=547442 RepID=A0AAQ3UGW1_PASNO
MDPVAQLAALRESMLTSGLLDEQFTQLQKLQDPDSPNFVTEIITLFCQDGDRIIRELTTLLDQPTVDFNRVDAFVHQLKGSSASVGAQKVHNASIQFREVCKQKNKDGCLKVLQTARTEFNDVRGKLQNMLQVAEAVYFASNAGEDPQEERPSQTVHQSHCNIIGSSPTGDRGDQDSRETLPDEVVKVVALAEPS